MGAPRCACHGEPQRWNKDVRCRAGGYWRCVVKVHAFDISPRGRDRHRRHAANRITVHVGDKWYGYRVDPGQKDFLKARLAAFRARQREQEETVGRLDTAVA